MKEFTSNVNLVVGTSARVTRIGFMKVRLAALVLVVAIVGAACRDDPPPSRAQRSGVEGVVLSGPNCPVVQEGSPCPDTPAEAEIQVTDPSTQEVIFITQSGADGRFRIGLPPGEFVLLALPLSSRLAPSGKPVPVTVVADRFLTVTLYIDTGMR